MTTFNESEKESPTLTINDNSKKSNKNDSNTEEHNQFFEPRTKSKFFNYLIKIQTKKPQYPSLLMIIFF